MELAIGPVFEEWADNITRLVLMVSEHDADAICCVQYWKPINYMKKLTLLLQNYGCSQQNAPIRLKC